MSKILTISVAAYNVEPYIKQNIESILRLFILKGEIILFMDYFNEVYKKIDIN